MIHKIISHFLLNVLALFLLTKIFTGRFDFLYGTIKIDEVGYFQTLIIAAFVFSLANVFIKPILKLLSVPLRIITLGLFIFVINGIVLMVVTILLPEYHISSFITAIEGSIFISFFQGFAHIFIKK